jgi:hypothetical protein
MPHYGLALQHPDHEERTDLVTERALAVGETFERAGKLWRVEAVEPAELGRFDAWLVCEPADEPLELH